MIVLSQFDIENFPFIACAGDQNIFLVNVRDLDSNAVDIVQSGNAGAGGIVTRIDSHKSQMEMQFTCT